MAAHERAGGCMRKHPSDGAERRQSLEARGERVATAIPQQALALCWPEQPGSAACRLGAPLAAGVRVRKRLDARHPSRTGRPVRLELQVQEAQAGLHALQLFALSGHY